MYIMSPSWQCVVLLLPWQFVKDDPYLLDTIFSYQLLYDLSLLYFLVKVIISVFVVPVWFPSRTPGTCPIRWWLYHHHTLLTRHPLLVISSWSSSTTRYQMRGAGTSVGILLRSSSLWRIRVVGHQPYSQSTPLTSEVWCFYSTMANLPRCVIESCFNIHVQIHWYLNDPLSLIAMLCYSVHPSSTPETIQIQTNLIIFY